MISDAASGQNTVLLLDYHSISMIIQWN